MSQEPNTIEPSAAGEQEQSPRSEQHHRQRDDQSPRRPVGRPKLERSYTHCQRCMKELTAKMHLRSGPTGPRTLCGSCGQKWMRDKKRGIDNSDSPVIRDVAWMTRMITMQQDLLDQHRRDTKAVYTELRRLDREISKLRSVEKNSPDLASSFESQFSSSSSYSSSGSQADEEEGPKEK